MSRIYGVDFTCAPRRAKPITVASGLLRKDEFLLEQVEREGTVQASGAESAELEQRLLVHGDQIHTESGKHKIRLETWPAWALRCGCEPVASAEIGRQEIEKAVRDLGGGPECLPWSKFERNRRSRSRLTSR